MSCWKECQYYSSPPASDKGLLQQSVDHQQADEETELHPVGDFEVTVEPDVATSPFEVDAMSVKWG